MAQNKEIASLFSIIGFHQKEMSTHQNTIGRIRGLIERLQAKCNHEVQIGVFDSSHCVICDKELEYITHHKESYRILNPNFGSSGIVEVKDGTGNK